MYRPILLLLTCLYSLQEGGKEGGKEGREGKGREEREEGRKEREFLITFCRTFCSSLHVERDYIIHASLSLKWGPARSAGPHLSDRRDKIKQSFLQLLPYTSGTNAKQVPNPRPKRSKTIFTPFISHKHCCTPHSSSYISLHMA